MSIPSKPDWRRMPASAVSLNVDGPDFVRLRAADARRYANECIEAFDRAEHAASSAGRTADLAEAEALRWETAAEAFATAWSSPAQPESTRDEEQA